MPDKLAGQLWMALVVLALFLLAGPWSQPSENLIGTTSSKLSYELQKSIEDWKAQTHEPGDVGPMIDLVVTLRNSVTEADLTQLRSASSSVVVQGAFGRLVQLQSALTQVEGIAALEQVLSITLPAAPIKNQ